MKTRLKLLQEQIYSPWCRCVEAMNVIVLEELKYISSNCSITVTMAVDFARDKTSSSVSNDERDTSRTYIVQVRPLTRNSKQYEFKVDRLQIIVVAKNITVLQLFSSRMPKMCATPQLVSAPLNPIPTVEHFRRSHPQCEHSYGQHIYMSEEIMQSKIKTLSNALNTHVN